MSSQLLPEDQIRVRAIGEVLHYVWGPIGIAGLPLARAEYDGYVSPIFSLLRSGATEAQMAAHLACIASDRMGIERQERSDAAAFVLVNWRDFLGAGRV